jgi:hypothetical protein
MDVKFRIVIPGFQHAEPTKEVLNIQEFCPKCLDKFICVVHTYTLTPTMRTSHVKAKSTELEVCCRKEMWYKDE